jgi:hypothetical protein
MTVRVAEQAEQHANSATAGDNQGVDDGNH